MTFISFPPPLLGEAKFKWAYVDQPPGRTNAATDVILRERSLLLIPSDIDGVESTAYEGFGRELDSFVLEEQVSSDCGIVYTRGRRVNLRYFTSY